MSKEYAEKKNKKPEEIKKEAQAQAQAQKKQEINSGAARSNTAPKATPNTTTASVKQTVQKVSNAIDTAKTTAKNVANEVKQNITNPKPQSSNKSNNDDVNKATKASAKASLNASTNLVSNVANASTATKAGVVGASLLPTALAMSPLATSALAYGAYKKEQNREVEIPTLKDDEVVDYYESIPDYNLWQRAFGKDAKDNRDSYKVKQQLADQYQSVKDESMPEFLEKNGLTPKDVTMLGATSHLPSLNPVGGKGIGNTLKAAYLSKNYGLSYDEAQDVLDYANRRFDNALNDALIEGSDDSFTNKVAATELSVPIRLASSTQDVAHKGVNYLTGRAMTTDDNAGARGMNLSQGMRDKVSEDMGTVGKIGYGIGTSMLDMLASVAAGGASGVGNAVSSGLMATQQASDVMKSAIERGLNPDQIIAEGGASALATAATEAVSLGKIDKIAKMSLAGMEGKELAVNTIKKFLSGFLAEGAQEVSENVVNTLADKLIAGEKSEIATEIAELEANGVPEKEAKRQAYIDYLVSLGLDFLGGGVAGGATVGVESGANVLRNNRINKAINDLSMSDVNNMTDDAVTNLAESLGVSMDENVNEIMPEDMPMPMDNVAEEVDPESIPNVTEEISTVNPEETNASNAELENVYNMAVNAIEKNIPNLESVLEDTMGYLRDNGRLDLTRDLANRANNFFLNTQSQNIQPTENNIPVVENPQPTIKNTGNEISKTVDSLKRSPTFRAQEERLKWIDDNIEKGLFKKEIIHERESLERAAENLAKNGKESEIERLVNTNDASGVDTDEFMMIIDDEMNLAEANNDFNRATDLIQSFVDKRSNIGRALQAMVKYTRTASGTLAKTMTMIKAKTDNASNKVKTDAQNASQRIMDTVAPNGKLTNVFSQIGNDGSMQQQMIEQPKSFAQIRAEVQACIANESSSIFNQFSDSDIDYLANMIQRGMSKEQLANRIVQKLETGFFEISPEDVRQVNEIFKQLDQMSNKNSKAAEKLEQQAYGIMAKYLGDGDVMEKWNAWRYLAMLGNPRTHIRNMVGNALFGSVTNFKDNVAGILESIFNRDEDRQRSFVTKLSSKDRAYIKAAKEDFDLNAYIPATDNGGKYDMQRDIEKQRKIFKDKGLGKAANWLVDKNGKALDAEDTWAIKNKYSRMLAGYLKAKGADISVLNSKNPADVALVDKARKFAIEQAKIATFHEDNAVADWLNQTSRSALNSKNPLVKLIGIGMESAVPFKKTPANILKQGAIEYNPLVQTGKGVIQTIQYLRDNPNKKVNMSDILDTWAKDLTGSAIMGLGAWLFSKGILRGAGKDEEDYAQKEQQYSLNFGNHSYTIDWAAPAALPLFMGAELYKWYTDKDTTGGDFFNALSRIGGPVIEMSMLQGLQDALANFSSGETAVDSWASGLAGLGASYISQAIPTLSGQIARTIDPYRRDTYTGEEKGTFSDIMKKQMEKNINKIPFLSKTNQPYRNTLGKPEENEDMGMGALGRGFLNMVSPGYYSETHTDYTYNKLSEIKDALESEGIEIEAKELFPSAPNKTYNGNRLTQDEYDQAKEIKGTITNDNLKDLFVSDAFRESSNEQKAELIKEINAFSNRLYEQEMFGKDIVDGTYKKYLDIYEKDGMDGLADYLADNLSYQGKLNEFEIESSAKAKEIYNNLGEEGLEQYADAIKKAESFGTDKLEQDEWEAYQSGDMDAFNKMVYSRSLLEENGITSTSATQKYIEEHGESGIKNLQEAQAIVSTMPKGKDEYGNTVYRSLTSDMLNIYDKDGAAGLTKYKNALNVASTYGTDNITTDEWKTFRSGDVNEFKNMVKYRTLFEKNDLSNSSLNRSYVEQYGEDIIPVLKDASDAISQIQKGVDKYGDAQYFNPNAKMIDIYQDKGKDGVEVYADLYTKGDVDDDPSKRSLHDTVPYLYSMDGLSDRDKGYYLSYFVSGKKVDSYLAKDDYAGLYRYYLDKYSKDVKKYGGG